MRARYAGRTNLLGARATRAGRSCRPGAGVARAGHTYRPVAPVGRTDRNLQAHSVGLLCRPRPSRPWWPVVPAGGDPTCRPREGRVCRPHLQAGPGALAEPVARTTRGGARRVLLARTVCPVLPCWALEQATPTARSRARTPSVGATPASQQSKPVGQAIPPGRSGRPGVQVTHASHQCASDVRGHTRRTVAQPTRAGRSPRPCGWPRPQDGGAARSRGPGVLAGPDGRGRRGGPGQPDGLAGRAGRLAGWPAG